jgi:hypothetical protein
VDAMQITKINKERVYNSEVAINIAGQTIDHVISNILMAQFGDLSMINHEKFY